MQKISAIIITFNESRRIARCLKSLNWCDEIVLVDSKSTDNTVEIAQKYTDRIFIEDWKGYGPQKQSALEKARGEWVLSIDADEVVTPELASEIKSVIGSTDKAG
ncbi:MAG: glycosyltransferase family 2 protein, partial [Nitrospirae bacterium]